MKYCKTVFFIVVLLFIALFNCKYVAADNYPSPQAIIGPDAKTEYGQKAGDVYNSLSFEQVSKTAINALKQTFVPSFPFFFGLVAMIVTASLTNVFSVNFGGFDIGTYVSTVCFSGYCFSVVNSLCGNLESYVEKLRNIVAVITPTLVAANVADGPLTAHNSYSGFVIALSVVECVVYQVVIPCTKALFVLSVVSCISSKAVDLRGINSSLRTFTIFFATLSMTAVVVIMHFQNVVAKAGDSIGMRAVRFASVNFVPLVGGLMGESVKTVTEALKAVRGIAGAAGAAAIISACLPPLAAIAVFKTELIICNCLAKTLGCTSESAIISDTNGIVNVLNAALLASTVGFFGVLCILAKAV